MEVRYRQRYLDLMANPRVRSVFVRRNRIISFLRRFLEARGFLEVETPMMQVLAGGATARPFRTYHEALGIPLYLRIAPELYLKRLVVGGLDRVFEINRNFRNEGVSTRHNPEFTMLEFYQAYSDYGDLMDLTEEMLGGLVQEVCQGLEVEYGPSTIDFSSFQRYSMVDAIRQFLARATGPLGREPDGLRRAEYSASWPEPGSAGGVELGSHAGTAVRDGGRKALDPAPHSSMISRRSCPLSPSGRPMIPDSRSVSSCSPEVWSWPTPTAS